MSSGKTQTGKIVTGSGVTGVPCGTCGTSAGMYGGVGVCGTGLTGLGVFCTTTDLLEGHPLTDVCMKQAGLETHNFIGDSGIKVSKICLGTLNFGTFDKAYGERPGQLNEPDCHKILDRYVELGGNFIDTANFYPWFGPSAGESEKIIGNWLAKQQREKLIICTKVRYPMNMTDVNSVGLSRAHILTSVDQSLKRLKTDYVDILSVNGWDEATSMADVLRTMDGLITSRKVRHIGCVDLKAWQLQTTIDLAKTMHMDQFISVSTEYSLLNSAPENEVMEVCRTRHCSMLPYSPLKGGYLTSKITSGMKTPPENTRIGAITKDKKNLAAMTVPFDEMLENPEFWNTIETCTRIGKKHGKTVAQVALRWLMQKDAVCSVIIGVRTIQQLEENMGALKFALDWEDMEELDRVSIDTLPTKTETPMLSIQKLLKIGRCRSYYTPNAKFTSFTGKPGYTGTSTTGITRGGVQGLPTTLSSGTTGAPTRLTTGTGTEY